MLTIDAKSVEIVHVNPRKQKHGKQFVLACDVKIRFRTLSTVLDEVAPGLRRLFYRHDPNDIVECLREAHGEASGQTALTDAGKTTEPVRLKHDYINMLVHIAHGAGDGITFSDARVNQIAIEPMEGGTCELVFRVQSLASENEVGILAGKMFGQATLSVKKNPDLVDAMNAEPKPERRGRKPPEKKKTATDAINDAIKAGDYPFPQDGPAHVSGTGA